MARSVDCGGRQCHDPRCVNPPCKPHQRPRDVRRYMQQAIQHRATYDICRRPMWRPPGMERLLEELRRPQEVLDGVIMHLDYGDLIALRQCSRRLYDLVDPRRASVQSKRALLLRAECDFPQNYNNGRWACYLCYKVREAQEFEEGQAEEYLSHRRFCIDCGITYGRYSPGKRITPKERGQVIWLCCCRPSKKHSAGHVARCDDCGMNAPFSTDRVRGLPALPPVAGSYSETMGVPYRSEALRLH